MRVLVCGSRTWPWEQAIFGRLSYLLECCHDDGLTIIEGGAKGADAAAQRWAKSMGVPLETYPAQWDKHGKAAGHIRNQQMLKEGKPQLVIAFHGQLGLGLGTRDMVTRAYKAGIPVELHIDPRPEPTLVRVERRGL